MKTKNNVQKAITKSVAVITSLVLLSFTVNAQGSLTELLADNSFGAIAKVLVENPSGNESGYIDSEFFNEANEESLDLEEWMISSTNDSGFSLIIEEANEESLQIENWMVIDSSFDIFDEIEEKPLQLE
ncbi:MAG: hypothetical protein HQ541_13155, partial [Mariniphaga sp.]|nr:hypothetical protein [Mariniphaga sp.]